MYASAKSFISTSLGPAPFTLTIFDMSRFATAAHLCSWARFASVVARHGGALPMRGAATLAVDLQMLTQTDGGRQRTLEEYDELFALYPTSGGWRAGSGAMPTTYAAGTSTGRLRET